ncbi:MAG TPA: serine acetyltransferase [Anaeromyxobacter sp.]
METLTAAAPSKGAHAAVPPRHWGLRHDREKYYLIILGTRTPTLLGKLEAWLWHPELPCIAVYRFGQLSLTLLARSRLLGALPFAIFLALQLLVRLVLHVEIPHKCRIGPAFHLGHPFTIVLGPTEVGANCNVTHNVTVGMGLSATGRSRGIPIIGSGVWIGPGATLTGPITVGDGATIAAGAVVSRDVPPRALVAGNPARVVMTGYDNSSLLGYTMPADEER